MAGLEDIVQRIVVDGTGEAGATFEELGHVAEAAFEAIKTSVEGADTALAAFSGGTLAIIGAVVAAGAAIATWTHHASEALVELDNMGRAAGTTAGGMAGLQENFEKAGVSAEQLGRMMARGAVTLADSWYRIQNEIETGASKMEQASLGVETSQIKLQESLLNASNASAEWADKLKSDALDVAEAFIKVQHASEDATSQVTHDNLSVQGAQLSLQDALQKQSEAYGGAKLSDYQKKVQEQDKANLAVAEATQRLTDARNKQIKDMQQAPLTEQRARLGLDQARQKQTEDTEKFPLEMQKTTLAVKEAQQGVVKAQHEMEVTLHSDLDHIASALAAQNVGELLKSPIDKIAETLRVQAANVHEAATGRREMPTQMELLSVWQQTLKQMGDQFPEVMKTAILQKIAPTRGSAGIGINSELQKGEDINKIAATHKDDFSEQQVKQAHENVSVWGEVSMAIKNFMTGLGVGIVHPVDALDTLADKATKAGAALDKISGKQPDTSSSTATGFDGGGMVRGPGSATSDSIPARLSNGEFVMRAAAVRTYGADFMQSLNELSTRGFALGGYVSNFSAPRFSGDGPSRASSTVNLHIDGQKFEGLRAPNDVAERLSHFAISRQMASTGPRPSWVR